MTIYNASLLSIDEKETRRYAGLRKAKFDDALIRDACMEAQLLARPKGIWQIYGYDAQSWTVESDPPFVLRGKAIGAHLSEAEKVIVLAATVGEEIESRVTHAFEEGRYAFSVLLDAAATAAVEQVADAMEKTLRPKAAAMGYAMHWRFSPGYGDWPLEQQPALIRASKAEEIGIALSSAMMLVPRKSITAIIGMVRERSQCPSPSLAPSGCASCNKADCPSRKP